MDRADRAGGLEPTLPDTVPGEMLGWTPDGTVGDVAIGRGLAIDRFVVIDRVGAGGMGVVLAAYDPELDRKVALKILRPHPGARALTPEQRARAVREAQAMAKLSHPNVITVHDVGTVGGSVFIAMELVDGGTLRDALVELPRGPRRWRRALELLIAAGRGLAAAHAAGLVHRDFKPDNVLVGRDGRVRVTDFGLVAPQRSVDRTPSTPALAGPGLTRAGQVMGTPRYMPPEQRAGAPADARSDQYAFCVALLEAVGGEVEPAESATVRGGDALAPATGPIRIAGGPGWLHRAIARGLHADPARRHRSMDALLAELTRDRAHRRGWIAAGAGALVVAATLAAIAHDAGARPAPCGGGERKLRGAWDPAVAARVHAALTAGGAPYADATWREVERLLDGYGRALTAMNTAACRATRVDREQSEAVLDLRTQCLDRRRSALAAATGEIASGGAIDRAIDVVAGLPAIDDCADPARWAARTPLPAGATDRARIAAVRGEIDRARAQRLAGELRAAEALAHTAADQARGLGFAPLAAEALVELAEAQIAMAAPEASATLREALAAADLGQDLATKADAWSRLVYLETEVGGHVAEAQAWLPVARAAVDALGGDPGRRAALRSVEGLLAFRLGDHGVARDALAAALAEYRAALGPDHPQVASAHNLLALALRAEGDRDGAIAHHRAALAIRLRLGADHPSVADSRTNLGTALRDAGRYREALAEEDQALAIRRRIFGDRHPEVAAARNNRAMVLQDLGRTDEAAAEYADALALHQALLPADDPRIATGHNNLGLALVDLGRYREAADHLAAALALRTRSLPPGHADVAITRANLGRALLGAGDRAGGLAALTAAVDELARALGADHASLSYWQAELGTAAAAAGRGPEALHACRRALAIAVEADGPDGLDASYGRLCVGRALLVTGDADGAVAALTPAVAALAGSEEAAFDVADARFTLARALRAAGRDPARARTLALAARDGFAASPAAADEQIAVAAFLRAR